MMRLPIFYITNVQKKNSSKILFIQAMKVSCSLELHCCPKTIRNSKSEAGTNCVLIHQ